MRREEQVTVQGPVKEQQLDGMSHMGGGGVATPPPPPGGGAPWQTQYTTHYAWSRLGNWESLLGGIEIYANMDLT